MVGSPAYDAPPLKQTGFRDRIMNKKLVATITLASFSQMACYNSYFIDKTELEKLESSVEPQEVVTIYGDCPSSASASIFELGPVYAQADEAPAEAAEGGDDDVMSDIEEIAGGDDTANDGTSTQDGAKDGGKGTKGDKAPAPAGRAGCTRVDVSTANALKVVTTTGDQRVTPFNFIMSGGQLVSPEYDVLVRLDDVKGAEVQEFSTWKTVTTIVGVSALAIGGFLAISLTAPKASGFQPGN